MANNEKEFPPHFVFFHCLLCGLTYKTKDSVKTEKELVMHRLQFSMGVPVQRTHDCQDGGKGVAIFAGFRKS